MEAKSFCIVQLGRIGDLILTTPLFDAIKSDNPSHKIYVLCGRNNHSFAKSYPSIDNVFIYWKKPIKLIKLLFQIRKVRIDFWIDPKDHYSGESKLFAQFSKAKTKIGFNRKNNKPFDITIPSHNQNYKEHVIKRYLKTIDKIGISTHVNKPKLFLNNESEERVVEFCQNQNISQYIHINISASLAERHWVPEKWIALISKLELYKIIITSDPKDTLLAQNIAGECEHSFYYKTSCLEDVYSVVNKASSVISPDTAIIHIASAFNIPVLGLYANREWNLYKFPPTSDYSKIVINKESDTFINALSVDQVFAGFEELMEQVK